MFSTKGHGLTDSSQSKWVSPCSAFLGKVVKIEALNSQNGTPGIYLEVQNQTGQKLEFTLWASEKAWPYTAKTLNRFGEKLATLQAVENIKAPTIEEYANQLKQVLLNKVGWFVTAGEEILIKGDDGETVWVKPTPHPFQPVFKKDEAESAKAVAAKATVKKLPTTNQTSFSTEEEDLDW